MIFLGFPDGGLSYLRFEVSRTPVCVQVSFHQGKPSPDIRSIIPHADYTGHDLSREIERVIARFRPNLVATTPADDWHPDHNATYFFVKGSVETFEWETSKN